MQLGVLGLGRMGANIARRLLRAGHTCVVYDLNQQTVDDLAGEGATGSLSLDDFVAHPIPPRAILLMLPAGSWIRRSMRSVRLWSPTTS